MRAPDYYLFYSLIWESAARKEEGEGIVEGGKEAACPISSYLTTIFEEVEKGEEEEGGYVLFNLSPGQGGRGKRLRGGTGVLLFYLIGSVKGGGKKLEEGRGEKTGDLS